MRKLSHSLNLLIKIVIIHKLNSKVNKIFYHTNNNYHYHDNNDY